jgi:hypothetical protein
VRLDAERRREVVVGVLRAIAEHHVDPAAADRIVATVRDRAAGGAYTEIETGRALAARLTADLRDASGDGLLDVVFHPEAREGERDAPARPPSDAAARGASVNFGFERAERLADNVGLLVVRGFHAAETPAAAGAATAAMTFLAHTQGLIFDLRENTGGAAGMATFLASFLFSEPVHLNTIAGRPGAQAVETWTASDVPGPRYAGHVLVLTSPHTYGAAEGFAYHLQARERAMVVGERTRGHGRLADPFRVDPSFEVWVTTGRSINPVTGTSWEGTGVVPDLEVPADQALRAAHAAARREPGRGA